MQQQSSCYRKTKHQSFLVKLEQLRGNLSRKIRNCNELFELSLKGSCSENRTDTIFDNSKRAGGSRRLDPPYKKCAHGAQKSLPGVATGRSVATQFVTALSQRFSIVTISRAICSDVRRGVATVCAVAGRVATEGAVPQLHGVEWHALSKDTKGVRSAPH
jgi:hypothetical protein